MRGLGRGRAFAGIGITALLVATAAGPVDAVTTPPAVWTSVAPLLTPHTGMDASRLTDGRVLVVGDGDGLLDTEIYDPASDTWTKSGDLGQTRFYFRGIFTLRNGKVLIAGGEDNCGCSAYATAELFDPATGTWSYTNPMHAGRRHPVTVQLADGRMLYATGASDGCCGPRNLSSEIYDPSTGTWSLTGNVNIGRDGATGVLLRDGRVLMTGGGTQFGFATQSEIFNPTTGIWSLAASTTGTQLVEHMTTLRDGRVLIAGGADHAGTPYLTTTQLYDPASNTWSLTGSLNYARASAIQVLLPDGKVLIAGGNDGIHSVLPAEIYDPATGAWTLAASMPVGVSEQGTASLADGRVFMAGGFALESPGQFTTAAEIYAPPVSDVFSGYLAPLNADPIVWNTGVAGRTYPIKWQLTDAAGAYITDAAAGTNISVSHVTCPNGSVVSDPIDYAASSGGSGLRYDIAANTYVYNWASPKSAGCYSMTVTTPDGAVHSALFWLR